MRAALTRCLLERLMGHIELGLDRGRSVPAMQTASTVLVMVLLIS